MPAPAHRYLEGLSVPVSDAYILWTPRGMASGIERRGKVFSKTGVRPTYAGGGAAYGPGPTLFSDGTTGKISAPFGQQGPNTWSMAAIFVPPPTGSAFIVGLKDSSGSGVYDRAFDLNAFGQVQLYIYDGVQRIMALGYPGRASAGTNWANIAIARCDGTTLYGTMNSANEATMAVSNGGYAGYNTATNIIEGLYGTVAGGGGGNIFSATGLIAFAFWNRFISKGEVTRMAYQPYSLIGGERPSAPLRAASRRRQILAS